MLGSWPFCLTRKGGKRTFADCKYFEENSVGIQSSEESRDGTIHRAGPEGISKSNC